MDEQGIADEVLDQAFLIFEESIYSHSQNPVFRRERMIGAQNSTNG